MVLLLVAPFKASNELKNRKPSRGWCKAAASILTSTPRSIARRIALSITGQYLEKKTKIKVD